MFQESFYDYLKMHSDNLEQLIISISSNSKESKASKAWRDVLKALKVDMEFMGRKQTILDREQEVLDKEESLSKRQKDLLEYEQEVSYISDSYI